MVAGRRQPILIAAPDSTERRIVQRHLYEMGHRVVIVPDAEAGLARLRDAPFSLLIWDLALRPGPVGQLLLAYPQLRSLAIGSFDNTQGLVAAAREGVSSFIVAPFGEPEVSYAVTSLLKGEVLSMQRSPAEEGHLSPKEDVCWEDMEKVINALISALEVKDRYSGSHSLRVAHNAAAIAGELTLPPLEVAQVRWASLLHDVGKLGVDSSVLTKPGSLTSDEYDFIKQHPILAGRIVVRLGALAELFAIIYHHHERYGGGGYPQGIGGEDIPLGARIIAVADVYDALVSDRPYRSAYPPDIAQNILQHGAGRQFDPEMVMAFISAMRREGTASYLAKSAN